MIFQYSLLLLFLCFAALSVSTETCGKDLLVGTSCIIKLRTKNNEKPYEIRWTHDRNDKILHWRDGKIRKAEGVSIEEDGSLRLQSVSLKDTGTYTYSAFNNEGTEIGKGDAEIKVYEKVPKPTVKIICSADGNATLTCDVGNSKDPSLTVSWYEDGKLIQNEINPQVFLSSTQVQENKTYSCETRNPVSAYKSESVTVSYGKPIQNEINPQVFLSSTQVQKNKTYSCETHNPVSEEKSESVTVSFSTETCGKDLLVGTSCIMKLRTKNNMKPYEIKWTHNSNGRILHWRDGKIRTKAEGVSMEENGSLRFQSVSLKDTGTYTYTAFNDEGTEIGKGEAEIKVYEKVPKPTVKIICTADGNAALTCDVGNSKDPSLTVSWYEDGKLIQNEINPQVFLSSTQVQENKTYSCETRNPVSKVKSESVTVSFSTETCGKDLLVGTSCIMKLRTKNNMKPYEIRWTHDRNDRILHWRDGRIRTKAEGVSIEEDGSLRLQSVSLKDTGTYTYTAFNNEGTEIGKGEVEIKVYEKVPKPTVKIICSADGNATLTCDVGNSKDPSLTVSWYKDGKLIQNEINPQVFLSSTQVQENKTYSCETRNPVSKDKSETVTVSCIAKIFLCLRHKDDSSTL